MLLELSIEVLLELFIEVLLELSTVQASVDLSF